MEPIFKNRENTLYKVDGKEIWYSRSPAVVAFIFAMLNEEIFILGEKRSENMPDKPGSWVVPCGYMDWDENGWNCLRREVYEETNFLVDRFSKYIILDNNKEPFYAMTEPDENNQNVALNYYIVLDFTERGTIPMYVEEYKNKEVSQVKWINIEDTQKYNWAFQHDSRMRMALDKIELKLKENEKERS